MYLNAVLSALVNVVILAALPFAVYGGYHKIRRNRSLAESARRAGLQIGDTGYLKYSIFVAIALCAVFVVWPPPLEPLVREGSAQRQFAGVGTGVRGISLALLYGLIKTGFAEEFLFRGLIAGSLSRRLPILWANLLQATIFLLPHLVLLFIMPEVAALLAIVFAGALYAGWLRIKSDSIIGPWLLHGAANVATALSVAARTSG